MTAVKYGSEAWTLRKPDEYLQDVLQKNCLRIVLGTQLTDRISNSRLYEKYGSIALSSAILKESQRWLGQIVWTKDERLIFVLSFSANCLGLNIEQVVLVFGGRRDKR